jgi:restriction system protein
MVAIGWPEVGNLGDVRTREEIGSRLGAAFPHYKRMQIVSILGQLYYFGIAIALDQFVLTYDPMEKAYLLGTVTGAYAYRPDLIVDMPHTRPVRWIRRVQRNALTRATLNSLGSIRTIFSISQAASTEIWALLHQLGKQ